ncbi:MAG: hypothetical protein NTV21_16840 [Planctomycetota bacterium]|nr:hypothetical protein [Planctomycetota bacterium]
MSTIGKILIALNLLLAGAFLGWAANSLNKTAELKKTLTAQVEAANAAKAKVQAELDSTSAALSTERQAKDSAQSESRQFKSDVERLQSDLDTAKRANEGLRGDVAKIGESLTNVSETLKKLDQEKTAALEAKAAAQQAKDAADRKAQDALVAQRNAEEAKAQADMAIADLEKSLTSQKKATAAVETKYSNLIAITGMSESDVTAQPDIAAQVVKVDYSLKPGLVALNKGKKDGIKRGFTFEIYNGTQYKGQIKVETVTDDTCAGLVVLAKDGATMNAGDSAASRL